MNNVENEQCSLYPVIALLFKPQRCFKFFLSQVTLLMECLSVWY